MTLCLLCMLACPQLLFAQLMQATSLQTVIHDYKGVASMDGAVQDAEGNIYTLAYVESGQVASKSVQHEDGPVYLLKTDKNGNTEQLTTIENNTSNHIVSLGIDKWGNLLIGGGFLHEISVNGARLAYTDITVFGNNNEEHAFLLKLDKAGGIIWFKEYPCSLGAAVNTIVGDEDGNLYAHITYRGQIMLGDTIVQRETDENNCIIKISPPGNILWHYISKGSTTEYVLPVMKLYKPQPDCPQQLLFLRRLRTDSLESLYNSILTEFSPDGKYVRGYHLFTSIWGRVDAIETAGDKIYAAGSFADSEVVAGVALQSWGGGVYLAEFNEMLQPQKVKLVMHTRVTFPYIASLKYADGYGLLMSASFADTITTNTGSYHSAPYSYKSGLNSYARGSAIFSFAQDMSTTDMQYVDGEYSLVGDFFPADNDIALTLWHVNYNPVTAGNYSNGFTICKAALKKQSSWNLYETKAQQDYIVYPIPFLNACNVRFDMPVYAYTYHIRNAAGQRIKDAKVSVYNDNTLNIEMGGLPAGIYFLKMDDCCDRHITVKLSKL